MKLAAVFSDNMVIQHGIAIPVWGWSEPGDKITVEFSPSTSSGQGGQKKTAVARKDGTWSVKLGKSPVSCEPREIRVFSKIDNRQLTIGNSTPR